MNKNLRYIIIALLMAVVPLTAGAQKFFNLTADEVKTDSVLPHFSYTEPLGGDYRDSVYTVTIDYPEFVDMPAAQIERYKALSEEFPPAMPVVDSRIVFDRKRPSLVAGFCPVVYREGRYRLLVSFKLTRTAKAGNGASRALKAGKVASATSAGRYADHSVLASGRWAKIRVPSTGVYELTAALARQAGFSDLSKVKIYGYGGNLKPEKLSEEDIVAHDDLKEVPTCEAGGRLLFYALGPVSWSGNTATRRTRNPYSDYGYYFITESDETPATVDSAAFISSFYPSADFYHSLYEKDGYSWYHGGRNLFDPTPITASSPQTVTIAGNSNATSAKLSVNVSAGAAASVKVELNGRELGTLNIQLGSYDKGNDAGATYDVSDLQPTDTVKFTLVSGQSARLDYVSMAWNKPFPAPSLTSQFPVPQYVYNITNQDHHADGAADMVIIIPTSQKLLAQATRLKELHETQDGMRVRIVPADELYNEFSSGTPDASAYRGYMKMLYDRAQNESDMPKYLVLFGDCVWDNRLLTSECSNLNADDLLLCFESENSFSEINCYVDDGYYCMLDDGEGVSPLYPDKLDVAVGRFPVTTADEAKIMMDKTIDYAENKNAGSWQNMLVFMGDDGNDNLHMRDVDAAAEDIASRYPGFVIKKVMWDAYKRETSATGNTYPDASRQIKQYQSDGALIMDYAGHGAAYQISHESVLRLTDFENFTNTNMPLWITASCDIMPFDGVTPTIGEAAVLNPKGGSMAFFGTTRTVYAYHNKPTNMSFLQNILKIVDGRPQTIGEAQRIAKNAEGTSSSSALNNLQYSLLGDPALSLNLPTMKAVIDSVNGVATSSGRLADVKAGSIMRIKGHVEGGDGFCGVASATVRDSQELVTCLWNERNDSDGPDKPFTYNDRPGTLYNGRDSISNGKFEFTFAVPKDISYSGNTGMINVYAVSNDHKLMANGYDGSFTVGGSELAGNDSIGPSVYCYLNSPSFVDGGKVNTTPYFVAQITDKDGINATSNGIGHDMVLTIDGDMSKTYVLNNNFSYDFGSYTKGSTFYSIPELDEGDHRLTFRVWDILNNPSTTVLTFKVEKSLRPSFTIGATANPATSSTTFIINHDRIGCEMDVEITVADLVGRVLWHHSESGVSTGSAYTVDWDLTTDSGYKLPAGVYIYKVTTTTDGVSGKPKAKKLIITNNN